MAKCELSNSVVSFTPVVLTITIESEEELIELWHRLNARASIFDEYLKEYGFKKFYGNASGVIWHKLNDILVSKNLKTKL